MRNIRSAIAGILALIAVAPAFGQGGVANYPQTVPAQTLVGRLGITPGPTQAIPISQLATVFGAKQSVTTNAKCDGATDDTAAINLDLAQGGYWTLPPGKTCNVTQLNFTVSGTRLSGGGFNSSILQGTTANVPVINISASLSNIYLDGFQVTNSKTATSGSFGIKANGDCQYCVFDGIFVQKQNVGISLQSTGVGYMRHVLSQYNLSDGISFQNSSVSGTVQWDLDDVYSAQNVGRGYIVSVGAAGPSGITLGSWHNIRTFANTGVGAAFVGTSGVPINGIRITKGFLGQDGNHEIFLDTYGGLHTITATYVELAGTSATGPTLATAASNTGDGIRITANNTDVMVNGAYANGNHDSGINTSATVVTSVNGSHISNHGLYGILSANCALLNGAGDFFVSNTSANISCTANSGSQIISGSEPSAVNSGVPLASIGGLGAGVATWLATPSSANLASAVTDETGSGALVFNNGPSLTNAIVGTQAANDNSTKAASTAYVDRVAKKVISSNTSFFVTTTGNDSNGCTNNSTDACLTIQRAYDNLVNNYRMQGASTVATISVGNGTYTAGLITSRCVDGQNGSNGVQIIGSATPANVVINATSNDDFLLGGIATGGGTQGCTQITIGGMQLKTTTGGNAINVNGGGVGITVGTPGFPIDFGTTVQDHMVANHGAWIIAGTNNTISGNALIHVAALSNAVIALHNTTVTCSGSPAFTYTAYADTNSSLFLENITFTSCGTATGQRYFAQNGGVIYTLSASATYIPGNSSGAVQSKGNYVTNTPSQWAISTDISGLGTGVATALGTASSTSGGFPLYNEGTFTPTLTTSGTVGTPVYSIQVGTYERVGRQVTARFSITLSSWGGSPTGNVSLAGLPIASTSNANDFGSCYFTTYNATGLAASNVGLGAFISTSATTALLLTNGNTGSNAVTAAQAGATVSFTGVCFYRA